MSAHDPGSDWENSYASQPHWDLGRPQPAFRALAEAGAFRGRVLDVGCGTGQHVFLCAALGLDATGIDVAAAPLRAAEGKARDRGLTARFVRHDVRRLAELGESFDTVLDCGLFHIFPDEDQTAYVDSVRQRVAVRLHRSHHPRQPHRPGRHSGLVGRPHEGGQHMLTAETTIQTTNASRFLVQLCEHATKIGHGLRRLHARMSHARPEVLDVDWSDTHGTLTLSWGRCVLDADPETLTVRVEADSEENLRGVQDLITADLERFGRREQLTVAWQQVQPGDYAS